MNFASRSHQAELLDSASIPFDDVKRNMNEINLVNKLLGGHRITINGFRQLLQGKKQVHVLEIGCGDGNNLFALQEWAKKQQVKLHVTGIDIKKECIDAALKKKWMSSNFICSDYKVSIITDKPDIIFSSLFCHHFNDTQLVQQLEWMHSNSRIGFFINDLHRHPMAYWLIYFIARVLPTSYLFRNDAPLSVARAFTKKEWEALLHKANIRHACIQWKWAFRFLIICRTHALV
jgi:2-polyprenyl-3-methyl-5-hydroxy-6-metoxy-1,4-benzoquinol methylase